MRTETEVVPNWRAPHTPDDEIDHFIGLIQKYAGSVSTIVCVGAMDGYELERVSAAFPSARAVALEGCWATYERFLKSAPFEAYPLAAGDKTGPASFYLRQSRAESSLFARSGSEESSCICVRLDDFCKAVEIERIDVLMVDAEGSGYEVLSGLSDMIQALRILTIETEVRSIIHPEQKINADVEKLLSEAGFLLGYRKPGPEQYESIWYNGRYDDASR